MILRYGLLFVCVACLINLDHLAYPERATVNAIAGSIEATPLRTTTLRLISPLATPAALQPILITTTAQLPSIPRDLLFANDQGLLRWQHITQCIETLLLWKTPDPKQRFWPDNHFVVSANGQKIVVSNQTRSDTAEQFDLQIYDLQTQQLTTVLTTTSGVLSLAIAPDATWIAYSLQTRAQLPRRPWWYTLLHDHPCGCGGDTVNGMIYVMRLHPPYQPMQLGSCSEFAPQVDCFGLVLWPVGQKQWRVSMRTALIGYTQERARLVALPELAALPGVSLSPFTQWSQLDRFVLLWTHPYPQLGDGILDTQTIHMVTFPQTLNGDNFMQRVALLKHDQVLMLYPALTTAEPHPSIEQWSINPDGEPFLKLTHQLRIPVNWDNYPGAPHQLPDGRVALALFNSNFGLDPVRGLYLLDHNFTELRQVNRLPRAEASNLYPVAEPLAGDVIWLPDGTGAIYVMGYPPNLEKAWYLPFDGSPPLDLQMVLGKQPREFIWLP